MRIVNKIKFVRTMSILIILIGLLIIFSKHTYSKGNVKYTEEYVYSGDTLWSISEQQIEENKYFENKDIREVINEIKYLNNLSNSNLKEGEKIKIPIYE